MTSEALSPPSMKLNELVELLAKIIDGTDERKVMTQEKAKAPDGPTPGISRSGNQIIIPEGMSYADARLWLSRQEEAEEKVVETLDYIECFPLDAFGVHGGRVEKTFGCGFS